MKRETRRVELPTGILTVSVENGLFDLDFLLGFAARANAKRGFLFLSKVLGKHWPVRPTVMREIHEALASEIPMDLPEPVVFIGMAETAVGLGQGVFEAYIAARPDKQAMFIHTTRHSIRGATRIEFEEAHSHAPRQFLHLPDDARLRNLFLSARSLVLIDDEASTGNTFFNLTNACRSLNPAIKHVHLAVITNFTGKDDLTRKWGLPVTMGAALNGQFSFVAGQITQSDPGQVFNPHTDNGASGAFGRLGIASALTTPKGMADTLMLRIHPSETALVLGTGEFMHPAFVLGRFLEAGGIDVMVQSTTRSPILTGGAVRHALTFPDNYGEGIANFIYNVTPDQYDHIIICHETPVNEPLRGLAARLNAQLLHFQP